MYGLHEQSAGCSLNEPTKCGRGGRRHDCAAIVKGPSKAYSRAGSHYRLARHHRWLMGPRQHESQSRKVRRIYSDSAQHIRWGSACSTIDVH